MLTAFFISKKEIIAFANSDGGTLYIGIRDDGGKLRKIRIPVEIAKKMWLN